MTDPGSLSEASVFAVAEDLGLDLERLRADMESDKVARQLNEVYALAEQIGIRGTPAFVIGDELIPGAISIEIMRAKVAEIRDGAS
jgi:predicted DsbA family dithiol-disulfide isomerase